MDVVIEPNTLGKLDGLPEDPVGTPGGVAGPLDASGVLPLAQISPLVLGASDTLEIDASTTPNMAPGAIQISHAPGDSTSAAVDILEDLQGIPAKAQHVHIATGATGDGDDAGGLFVQVDGTSSTGGHVDGLHVETLGAGIASVSAVHAGSGVAPIRQIADTSALPATVLKYVALTSTYTDITAQAASDILDVTMFSALNDKLYVGHASQFDAIQFVLQTPANDGGIKPEFRYWDGASWVEFGPVDGTSGMRRSGTVPIHKTDLTGWVANTVNGVTKYWIEITRTKTGSITAPVEDTITVVSGTTYLWDEDGNISGKSLSVGASYGISSAGAATVSTVNGLTPTAASAGTGASLAFPEPTGGGTSKVTVQAPALSGDATLTLPSTSLDLGTVSSAISTLNVAAASAGTGASIALAEPTGGGTSKVTIVAPALSADATLTLPSASMDLSPVAAGFTTFETKSSNFVAVSGGAYRCTNSAGVPLEITLPANGDVLVWRAGAGAVVVYATTAIEGSTAFLVVFPRGITRLWYDGSTWRTAPGGRPIGWFVSGNNYIRLLPGKGLSLAGANVTSWTCELSGRAFTVGAGTPTYSATGAGNHPAIDMASTGYLTTAHVAGDNFGVGFSASWADRRSITTVGGVITHMTSTQGWATYYVNPNSVGVGRNNSFQSAQRVPNDWNACTVRNGVSGLPNLDTVVNMTVASGVGVAAPTAVSTTLQVGANNGAALHGGLINHIILWDAAITQRDMEAANRASQYLGAD